MPQSDFSSYLSHSALLINTIAIITSSGRFSIYYTSFISVPHTLHLNYYHMQSQYKSVIAEPKGEATNRDALSFRVCIYVCMYVYMYVYPSQSIRDTSIA